ncbi:hypothetical protein [Streptomyces sp. NPDC090994]|uniref:hypothetical protein n=1 Tax=Streptomyces sp. NPDC090994 TaxID=3365969 RepID=UPI0038156ACD
MRTRSLRPSPGWGSVRTRPAAIRSFTDFAADAYAVHRALDDIGTAMVGGFLGDQGPGVGTRYHRLAPGQTARVG